MKNYGKLIVRYTFMALSVIIMALIFCFSSQDGNESGELSGSVATFLQSVFDFLHMPSLAEFFATYVRRFAHAFIYAALGLCVSVCTFTFEFRRKWLWVLLPAAVCFLYACSDEFHQIFISGRDGKFADVLVDSVGFLTTIIVSNLVNFLIWLKKRPKEVD